MTPQPNKTRVPVLIDRDVYDRYKVHAKSKGITVASLIREALTSYLRTLNNNNKP